MLLPDHDARLYCFGFHELPVASAINNRANFRRRFKPGAACMCIVPGYVLDVSQGILTALPVEQDVGEWPLFVVVHVTDRPAMAF